MPHLRMEGKSQVPIQAAVNGQGVANPRMKRSPPWAAGFSGQVCLKGLPKKNSQEAESFLGSAEGKKAKAFNS